MNPTILYLTDFSKCAEHALQFLIPMAKLLEAKVMVVYGIGSPAKSMTEKTPLNIFEELEAAKKEVKINLDKVTKVLNDHEVANSSEIVQGMVTQALADYAAELKPDLILMGTVGNHALDNRLMGSLAYKMIKASSSPVMVIPINAQYQQLEHLTYATNFLPGDFKNLQFLLKLVTDETCKVDIVHVTPSEGLNPEQEQQLDTLKARIAESEFKAEVSFTLLSHQKVMEGLMAFIEDKQPQVLALASLKRNFWDRLINKSLTKTMIDRANVPMLVFTSMPN